VNVLTVKAQLLMEDETGLPPVALAQQRLVERNNNVLLRLSGVESLAGSG